MKTEDLALYGAGALAIFALLALAKRPRAIDVVLPSEVIWFE